MKNLSQISNGVKKIFLVIFLGSLLLPLVSLAGEYQTDGTTVHYEGLVPCGKSQPGENESELVTMPCQFCHFFVMIEGIIDFILFRLIPPIAVLMLVIGGIMFMVAMFGGAEMLPGGIRGGPTLLNQSKRLITSVVIGLVIIFAAWLIINVFFTAFGFSEFGLSLTGPDKWAQINCSIQLPE
jgi:hypothetical protein